MLVHGWPAAPQHCTRPPAGAEAPLPRRWVLCCAVLCVAHRLRQHRSPACRRLVCRPAATVSEGAVSLCDKGAGTLICEKWNAKGGKETSISAGATSVGIDIDMIVGEHTSEAELLQAGADAARILTQYCGATDVSAYLLSPESPSISLGGASTLQLPALSTTPGAADAASSPAAATATPLATTTEWIQAAAHHQAMSVDAVSEHAQHPPSLLGPGDGWPLHARADEDIADTAA